MTWGEQINKRCPGQVHHSELASGTYEVKWRSECFFTTHHWTIAGVVTREVRRLMTSIYRVIIWQLNSTQVLLPNQLSDPRIIRLYLPSVETDKNTEINPYSFCSLFAMIFIIFIFVIQV